MLPEARENAKGGASSLHQSDSESKPVKYSFNLNTPIKTNFK